MRALMLLSLALLALAACTAAEPIPDTNWYSDGTYRLRGDDAASVKRYAETVIAPRKVIGPGDVTPRPDFLREANRRCAPGKWLGMVWDPALRKGVWHICYGDPVLWAREPEAVCATLRSRGRPMELARRDGWIIVCREPRR